MKHYMFWATFAWMTGVIAVDISAEEKGKPRAKSVAGVVAKVDADSLTITQRGDSGERSIPFAISPRTKILVQTSEDESIKGGEAGERKIPKAIEGKIGDVKVDQRVTVSFIEVGNADSVVVMRPTPPRRKEGEN